MSQTYSLGCMDCKVELWVGQSSYLYKGEKNLMNLTRFLHDHQDCHLKFVNDIANDAGPEPWDDFEDYEVLPLGKKRTKLLAQRDGENG